MRVIITCQGAAVDEMALKLTELGLGDVSVLQALGIITGEIDPEKISELEKIPGIVVEPDVTVQLPPPDSPLQ
ncbi:MAG: hypothetical protein ABFD97_00250 [Syntrophobacter sp.]